MKSIPLDPVEWDFREVAEEELEAAIFHEYRRSSALLVSIVRQCRDGTIDLEGEELAPGFYADALLEFPDALAPWVRCPKKFRQEEAKFLQPSSASLEVNPGAWVNKRFNHWKKRYGRAADLEIYKNFLAAKDRYVMRIDLSCSVPELLQQFERWVRSEARTRKVQKTEGKAALRPWHKLKRLAAWRLVRNGRLTPGQDLSEQIGEYRRSRPHPKDGYLDVLPQYDSWSKALTGATREIKIIESEMLDEESFGKWWLTKVPN